MNLVSTVKNGISKVLTYWKTPPLGKYMNFKEIAALAGGGIGVKFIITCVQGVMIAVGNVFIGNTIGIEPMPMYAIYILSIIASFPLTMLRAYIIDNTRSRKGKYRPYIISMGLPTIVLAIGYFWMPYEHMNQLTKCIVVLLFNIGFQFFFNFLYDAYDNYIVVLSPNTQERSNVASIRAIADSLAPTITGAIIPLLGKAITGTDNLFDIRIYRYIWPPILILGFFLSLIIYVNTEEKIVQAKTHVVQIKFIDALRAVAKNKYFWIISLAGWLGFLESAYGNILGWLYTYQHACTPAAYAIITTVYGNASLWGMMLAPVSIKRIGKKNTLVFTNLLNIVFIAMIYPIVKHSDPAVMIWLVMCCLWMNALVGSFTHILTPSLNGDIRDYQQYITGERIDGMFAAVGLIGSAVTMVTSSVLPAIYEYVGINKTKLQELLPAIIAQEGALENPNNVYNVLYHRETFVSIFAVLIGASVIGAFLNVLPYFWYDLSEVKQRGMIKVLQIRALFEDYGNGVLKDKDLVEAIETIREAQEFVNAQPKNIAEYKQAKKSAKGKEAKKKAKKEYREAIEFNQNIEISKFVVKEMNRFNTPEGIMQLKEAREAVDAGYDFIYNFDKSELSAAKALPSGTPEEKEYRKAEITRARDTAYAQKAAKKYFPKGIKEFDVSIFESLFSQEDELSEKLEATYQKLYKARDEKDKAAVNDFMSEIKAIKAEQKALEAKIKQATNDNSVYNRAAKPYINAKNMLTQSENYSHLDEIASMYDDAKIRHEKAQAEAAAEAERIKAEEKAYGEKLKAEKAAKKAEKKIKK
ncbi:MAG: MFS transporter [Acutalibacteraceae bacterium]